jgi:hypothetical protein
VDECVLVGPSGVCLNGEGGRGMDLKVVLAPFGDEGDRSSTTAALLLTLAFGRKAGSELWTTEDEVAWPCMETEGEREVRRGR